MTTDDPPPSRAKASDRAPAGADPTSRDAFPRDAREGGASVAGGHEGAVLDGRELLQLYAARTGPTQALRGVDVAVRAGRVTAITGPSGSGKSTLLAVLALRERPAGGELRHRGRLVSALSRRDLHRLRRREIGWVAQRPAHSLFPQLDARGQIAQMARLRGLGPGGTARPKDEAAARAGGGARHKDGAAARGGGGAALDVIAAALEEVGLSGRATARPSIMSGGEQQRLAVAAAAVGPPGLLIADEPTAELDDESAELVLRLLRDRAARGSAVLMATHDARAIAAADTVLRLRHGVLSGEDEAGRDRTATIDGLGRLQLPEEALPLFPDGRVVVTLVDGHVELHPPGSPS